MSIPADSFFLDPGAEGTLQSQVRGLITEGILSGRLRPGEKLPSSRKLAAHLGVSRITITLAYNDLLADDYITARGRSGYYVSDDAPTPPRFAAPQPSRDTVDWTRVLSQRFSDRAGLDKPADWRSYRYPFIYGQADETLFDRAGWRLCALEALGLRDFDALTADYHDQDDPLLIDFIARHTLPRRGILAKPDEILVTMGAQNALWLTAQVLLTQRRTAIIEDPCYPALRDILNQSRCRLLAIPVDGDGFPPDHLSRDVDVVFTTPSHQCPTNATMPIDRRQALLDAACRHDLLIVEDDYEFELSFLTAPQPALKSLDREGRVLYVGSFSKSLFPGLRLGYLVGPAPFIAEARALRASVLRHPPGHLQRTAAYFLSRGHYDAHIRRMSKTFHRRRDVMEAAIDQQGLTIAGRGVYGGSSFWMQAPEGCDTGDLAARLRTNGVLIEPGAAFFSATKPPTNYYRLAYSSIPEDRIEAGIKHVSKAIG